MVKELGSGVYLLFGSVYYVYFLSFMFSKCVSISFLVIMSQCFNTQNIQLVEGSLETKVPTISRKVAVSYLSSPLRSKYWAGSSAST